MGNKSSKNKENKLSKNKENVLWLDYNVNNKENSKKSRYYYKYE